MIAAVTGHRPEKIMNWQYLNHQLAVTMADFNVDILIQGMAAGVDLQSAKIAHNQGVPFWCARPWKGHKPRKADESNYNNALKFADKVVDVTDYEDYPGAWVYQKRNEWMVDNSDMLLAFWDGSPGGTANCVKYAVKQKQKIWRVNILTTEVGWYEPKA